MLEIIKTGDGDSLTLKLVGKLNSVTSQNFKNEVVAAAKSCNNLFLDFSELQYIASAGLRIVLEVHKSMSAAGKTLTLTNVDKGTLEILRATGLTRFLNIKQ